MEQMEQFTVFETAAGFCGIAWNEVGVTRFRLPSTSADATKRNLLRRIPNAAQGIAPESVAFTVEASRRYFQGENVDFSSVVLDISRESALFQQLYAAARRLSWGRTTTYGSLAKEVGAGPESARLVGQAMATNPVPLIIPCHRVLAAGGKIGGFSAPGGSDSKLRMLQLEGVNLGPPPSPQQSMAF